MTPPEITMLPSNLIPLAPTLLSLLLPPPQGPWPPPPPLEEPKLLPVTVTFTVPPRKYPLPSPLMPLPPVPLLVMVRVPAFISNSWSALMPAVLLVSVTPSVVVTTVEPVTLMVVSPPSKRTRLSLLKPFLPPADTLTPMVPPLTRM